MVKTRVQVLQQHPPTAFGSLHTFLDILRTEGVTGLFRGATPRIVRRTLMVAINWTIYEQMVMAYDRWLPGQR